MTSVVHWRETIDLLEHFGIKTIVEIGPGKILSNMGKRDHPKIDFLNIETVVDLEAFAARKRGVA
jgi:[acyl-carrier-protein] S-malonyltransferase